MFIFYCLIFDIITFIVLVLIKARNAVRIIIEIKYNKILNAKFCVIFNSDNAPTAKI